MSAWKARNIGSIVVIAFSINFRYQDSLKDEPLNSMMSKLSNCSFKKYFTITIEHSTSSHYFILYLEFPYKQKPHLRQHVRGLKTVKLTCFQNGSFKVPNENNRDETEVYYFH